LAIDLPPDHQGVVPCWSWAARSNAPSADDHPDGSARGGGHRPADPDHGL